MKILPASGSKWFDLSLLPFKIFVPAGYVALVIERDIVGYRHDDPGLVATIVLLGYMVSFCVLVVGAVIQRSTGRRRAYLWTCGFILALLVFSWLTLPYLAHT
jgi:hypothetical protein